MAGAIQDLYSAMISGAQAISKLTTTISSVFPGVTASSTLAPSTNGSIAFSSSLAAGFILVQTSSGATVKVAWYNQ